MAPGNLVGHGRQGAHLGQEPGQCNVDLLLLAPLGNFRIKCPQRIDHGRENAHGMGPSGEIFKERPHILMDKGMVVEQRRKEGEFFPGRESSIY